MIYDPATRPPDLRYRQSWPTCDTGEFCLARPRQLLYSDSIIAVSASTGKYVWHYQLLAGDVVGNLRCPAAH